MKIRVSLFCSLFRGHAMLQRLLLLQRFYPEIEIVGVVTDDPDQPWTNAKNRVWKHVTSPSTKRLVTDLAEKNNLLSWTGKIGTSSFIERFTKEWQPDVCYMGVFGQKVPEEIWSYPLFGFFNFHSCGGLRWPSNMGGNPIEQLTSEGQKQASIAMHQIDNDWDNGELLAFSSFFPLSSRDTALTINELSAPLVADMMEWHLLGLLGVQTGRSFPRVVNNAFGKRDAPNLMRRNRAA